MPINPTNIQTGRLVPSLLTFLPCPFHFDSILFLSNLFREILKSCRIATPQSCVLHHLCAGGLVFGSNPLEEGAGSDAFEVRIDAVDSHYAGALKVGVTTVQVRLGSLIKIICLN